jgi:adenylyltransferase/sulfurtransferase
LFWVESFGLKLGRVRKQEQSPNKYQVQEKSMSVPEIRVEELKQRLDAGENLFLLDVRDEYEYEISNIGGQLIPLPELPKRVNELDANLKIITVCKMGPRGAKAAQVLHNAGFTHVWNRVDHAVRKY